MTTQPDPDDGKPAPKVALLRSALGWADTSNYRNHAYPPGWGYQRQISRQPDCAPDDEPVPTVASLTSALSQVDASRYPNYPYPPRWHGPNRHS